MPLMGTVDLFSGLRTLNRSGPSRSQEVENEDYGMTDDSISPMQDATGQQQKLLSPMAVIQARAKMKSCNSKDKVPDQIPPNMFERLDRLDNTGWIRPWGEPEVVEER